MRILLDLEARTVSVHVDGHAVVSDARLIDPYFPALERFSFRYEIETVSPIPTLRGRVELDDIVLHQGD